MVELRQVRQRHLHRAHQLRLLFHRQWRRCRALVLRTPPHALQNGLDVETGFGAALLDDALHGVDRVLRQQLQHADVLLGAAARTVLSLQRLPQFVEHLRQLPAAKDVGVVQRRRPAFEAVQIVLRKQDLLVPPVGARVRGNHLASQHYVDALDVNFDRYLLEGGGPGDAIAIGVATHLLVLIDLGRLIEAGIKRVLR